MVMRLASVLLVFIKRLGNEYAAALALIRSPVTLCATREGKPANLAYARRGERTFHVDSVLLALGHVADLSLYGLAYLWRFEPSDQTLTELCRTDEIPRRWSHGRISVLGGL
jgi:hypothetical protein